MPFTDIDARRRAATLAPQLPPHLPDALAVIRHMEILTRYCAGYLDAPATEDQISSRTSRVLVMEGHR